MKVDLSVKSDQLNKEDLRALLQAIRDCEMATFPDKKIYVSAEAPELSTDDMTEILTSIKPPYSYGPVIFKYAERGQDDQVVDSRKEQPQTGFFIKTGTRDKLTRKANEGGGFMQAEVLVTNNLELTVPDPEERKYWVELCKKKETVEILTLENGKRVFMDGKSIDTDEAHEIIIRLTQTWGNDFEKQHLRDLAIMG